MTTLAALRRPSVAWNLVTFASGATGLIWQLVLALQNKKVLVDASGAPPGASTRIIRYFSYFTVEANVLVAVVALSLVLIPNRNGRIWRVIRLQSLYGIIVTGIVYSTLLRGVVDLHGPAAVTNALLHYVAPLLAAVGWLLFGPRPRIDDNTLVISLIWPALYMAYTFAHGAASHWYPYPFVDVDTLGYVTVLRNGVALNVLLVGIGALLMWLDRRLPKTADPG